MGISIYMRNVATESEVAATRGSTATALQQGLLLPWTQLLSHLHSLFCSFSLVSTLLDHPLYQIFSAPEIWESPPLHVVMGVDSPTPHA
jgi:hypothetical protein